MQTYKKPSILFLAKLGLCALAALPVWLAVDGGVRANRLDAVLPRNPTHPGAFSPSLARTETGGLIAAEEFIPAARCASCHADTHAEWAESLHRNAARAPFYKESVNILRETRGNAKTQHCESCHLPAAVFSGALLNDDTGDINADERMRAAEDEGVTCVVCHSITEARLDGTGSYTIRRPAMLEREDGTKVYGEATDEAIRADVPSHRRAMMRPLLKTPEFCAACHKSSAPPELNGYKFLRGFSVYDEWQQSGASGEAVQPYYRRDARVDCRGCHMPRVESRNDLSAKEGTVVSHRWLGANTATPLFYKQTKQAELVEDFLKANVLNVDIFSLENASTGQTAAPLAPPADARLDLRPGHELIADVVIANRRAAHSFPPELRDLYEPWVEFEAIDASGRTLFHSGFLKPDGSLDPSAHAYKAVLLDESSRVITRHEVWLSKIKAYDNSVPTGRSDIARYRFRLPAEMKAGALTLRARVNYRRFAQVYADYVSRRQNVRMPNPTVVMATAEVRVGGGGAANGGGAARRPRRATAEEAAFEARRWNDYGIGLMEQAQYGPAARAFLRAGELSPRNPDPLISAAVAEMKTERFGPELEQLTKAAALLDRALALDPKLGRGRFYRALVSRAQGHDREAAGVLAALAAEYPRDREVARQLGQTLYGLGRLREARAAFEAVVAVDPTDAGAYQFLAPIYAAHGQGAQAERARALYLLWRDDPLADVLASRFYVANPQWAEERVWYHVHGEDSPPRPTLTSQFDLLPK